MQDREPFIAGINDLGQIVGVYNDAIGAHAFLYSGGVPLGGGGFDAMVSMKPWIPLLLP